MSNSVKWNELAYFETLPVAAEPDYANGFTCDVCAIELATGPFYHNAKKGRDACLRCAVEAGVHYLPGAVCSLLLPSADTVESLSAAAAGFASSPQRILCVLQFTTESFAVVFGDDTSVTLYGKDPLTSGFTSALVPSAKGKRDRDGRLSRSSLVDAARGAGTMPFSEAARRFPALRQLPSPAAVTGGKAFPTVVELCSPLQPPTVGSAPPPCLLWHNLTVHTAPASRDSDALLLPKHEEDAEQAGGSSDDDLLAYGADATPFSQLICVIVSRVLHAWHPPSGVEVLLDVSSQLGGPPLASRGGRAAVRAALEGCVRGVFQHGYAVTGWKAEQAKGKRGSPVPPASASVGACREKVHKILDGLARVVPWN